MGEEQKVGYEELLAASRAGFEAVPDFTLAVEEEFALLDPTTLDLVNRFEELQQAAKGTELEPHLVGELIASEVEVRTGRCDTFAEAMDRVGERRAQLRTLADGLGVGLSSVGTHPWSPWQEQRLLALSASSPFVEGVFTYLHSSRTQIFTRMFPRCGIPDALESWDEWESYIRFLYQTGSMTEHTQLWWSVRPHLQFPTVEIRICDAQPELAEARALVALIYALTARIARALDEGEPLPSWPHRLLEENFWRAIRCGLSGELIDFERGESIPARARLEQLVEWVQPVADELGVSAWLSVPERNAAERQIARHEEGASMEQIFAEQVAAGERVTG